MKVRYSSSATWCMSVHIAQSKTMAKQISTPSCWRRNQNSTERLIMAQENLSFFELNTGAKIPAIGMGAYRLLEEHIVTAVKIGYRHIDTAVVYGDSEREIGRALQRLFDEGAVKREDMFITSKLWGSHHLPEDVPIALEKTLEDLQLDYLDLYLIHLPVSYVKGPICPENMTIPNIPATWKAMEALYESGKAKAIGVSNFSTKKMTDLLDVARIPPAVNQVELHPLWQQQKLHEFCKSKGIHLTAYSPLGTQFGEHLTKKVLENPVIKMVGEKLGKTPAQVILRWVLQMGHSVLPKTKTESRMKENLAVFDWSIPDDLLAKFSEIHQEKLVRGMEFVHETYGPYRRVEDLWDGEISEQSSLYLCCDIFQLSPC